MKGDTSEQTASREVVPIDHTGARHSGERYDAMQALRDAEIAALPQSEDEVLWPDWNREMRGREWG